MLAAWMRAKYPSALDGAIAGSAPIWAFEGLVGAMFSCFALLWSVLFGLDLESCHGGWLSGFVGLGPIVPHAYWGVVPAAVAPCHLVLAADAIASLAT